MAEKDERLDIPTPDAPPPEPTHTGQPGDSIFDGMINFPDGSRFGGLGDPFGGGGGDIFAQLLAALFGGGDTGGLNFGGPSFPGGFSGLASDIDPGAAQAIASIGDTKVMQADVRTPFMKALEFASAPALFSTLLNPFGFAQQAQQQMAAGPAGGAQSLLAGLLGPSGASATPVPGGGGQDGQPGGTNFFAAGGTLEPGALNIVGEAGPEAIVGDQVTPLSGAPQTTASPYSPEIQAILDNPWADANVPAGFDPSGISAGNLRQEQIGALGRAMGDDPNQAFGSAYLDLVEQMNPEFRPRSTGPTGLMRLAQQDPAFRERYLGLMPSGEAQLNAIGQQPFVEGQGFSLDAAPMQPPQQTGGLNMEAVNTITGVPQPGGRPEGADSSQFTASGSGGALGFPGSQPGTSPQGSMSGAPSGGLIDAIQGGAGRTDPPGSAGGGVPSGAFAGGGGAAGGGSGFGSPGGQFPASTMQGAGTGVIARLLQQNPEVQAFQTGQDFLGGLLSQNPGQPVIDAAEPVFQRNLQDSLGRLRNEVPSVFNSGLALRGTDLASRALQDFNLFSQQAAQQGINQQLQGLSGLGQLAGQAGQNPFSRALGAGQFGLAANEQAFNQTVNPTLQLLLAALNQASPTANQTIAVGG